MDFYEKKLLLLDALLSSKGMHELINTSAAIMGNPIAIIDMGLSPIMASSELCDDDEWTHAFHDINVIDIKEAVHAGDFKRVYSSDKTVLGEYPGAKQRYLAARIRRGGNILGHALVLERNKSFEEEDHRLLPDICRVFGYELTGQRDTGQLSERYGTLLEDIIGGRLEDKLEIEARLRRAQISLADRLVVIVFSPTSYEGQISARYLRQQLIKAFPGSLGIIEGEDVVLITNAKSTQTDFVEALSESIYTGSLHVGVSRVFCGLENARFAYEQASAAIRLSSNVARVVHYDEVFAAHLMESAARNQDTRIFSHPAVEALAAADKRDCGTYLQDLQVYLDSGRNATVAAQMCCVHKNTMYYRLKKIESIANIDLADETTCFALQLSLSIRRVT